MELKRLVISGFKSFVDRTELSLGTGVTALVGPNGCGKTNVAEAIRWALGEQNARILRGERMEDLIFNGTRERPPVGMAEVTLTFTNEQGLLPIDFEEVEISRRLYRSGESEYLINRSPCRLRDVTDLIVGTGAGPHAYAIFEQRMVEALLSSDPAQRRAMFEQAAGIAKYHAQKHLTLRKLKTTQQDLHRVEDLVAEVEKLVRSLSRQAKAAARYGGRKEELRKLVMERYRRRHHDVIAAARALEGELSEAQARRDERMQWIAARTDELVAWKEHHDVIVQRRTQAQDRAAVLTSAMQRAEEQLLVLRERQLACDERRERSTEATARLRRRLAEVKNEARSLDRESKAVRERRTAGATHLRDLSSELSVVESQLAGRRALASRMKTQLGELLKRESERRAELSEVAAKTDAAAAQREFLAAEVSRLADEVSGTATRVSDVREELRQEREKADDVAARSERLRRTREELQAQLERVNGEREAVSRELSARKAELETQERARQQHEGMGRGVHAVLVSPLAGDALIGVLADMIKVPAEFERAIEGALAHRLQYVVARARGEIRDAVRYLRKHGRGRASFVTLGAENGDRPRELPPELASEGGVVGLARDLVECEESLRGLIASVLRDVVVVKDFDLAWQLADRYAEWSFVTLKGDLIERGGIVTGGSTVEPDLVARRRRGEELRTRVEALAAGVTALEREGADLRRRLEENDREIEGHENGVRLYSLKLAELEQRIAGLAERERQLRDKQRVVQGELGGVTARSEELLAEKGRLDEIVRRLGEDLAALERDAAAEDVRVRGLAERRTQLSQGIDECNIRVIRFDGQLERLVAGVERANKAAAEIIGELGQVEKDGAEALESTEQLNELIGETRSEVSRLKGEQTEAGQAVERLDEEARDWSRKIEQGRAELEEARQALTEATEHAHRLRMQALEREMERKSLEERVRDEHGDVALADLEPLPELSGEELGNQIETLTRLIGRMEPVNMLAVEEHRRERERLDHLVIQRADLVEARKTLGETVRKLDRTARTQFLETFDAVQQNFRSIFERLFEGGYADIRIEEGVDPLEAHIEIVARPRGKRLSRIELLSGGERALVAIGLLFAFYLVKPSPFCLLDEIDAPLDDMNIGRFTALVKELSERTQFAIITHNKRTMEIADCLYGITMQEPGVSKVVSVRFGGDGNGGEPE
ncbi:hypothetical protein AMJ82_04035 [candidate division TA06 bacterium SM23_40]|uniref:Chromosome partition protein Smc n=2 Tax=Bacteria division TA06 TaxID=1156500 RepID=A0A0S8GBJ9_UNCT6|nr:MAG: hypothetical protein AMJ82_04035 [candidate division TA06 bacterium SM23_40]